MTLEEFIAKYKGKFVEIDGVYLYQCVDLVKAYHREVIGGNFIKGNAIDYAKNPEPDYYDYYPNTLFYIPPRGAISVWNSNIGGGFGHTGIVLGASLMGFRSFDQNWPKGSPAIEASHNYKNVLGFLVPKKKIVTTTEDQIILDLRSLVNKHRDALIS